MMTEIQSHDLWNRRSRRTTKATALAVAFLGLSVDWVSALVNPIGHERLRGGTSGLRRGANAGQGTSNSKPATWRRVKRAPRWPQSAPRHATRRQATDTNASGADAGAGAGVALESPLPEGFPEASTLLRPAMEPDPKLFIETTREEFRHERKRKPLKRFVGAVLRPWRLPFGRIPKQAKLLTITLKGEIPSSNPGDIFGDSAMNLIDLTRVLRTAAHDRRIESILLRIEDGSAGGLSTIMELRRAMDYFRQSGKPLWGFAEEAVSVKELYILGGCTKAYATPEASVDLLGISLNSVFFKTALDKLGIEPQVRRIGEFKTFGDTYARSSMSEANREVTEYLLKSVSDFNLRLLAHDAGQSPSEVEAFYDRGVIQAKQLKEFGLVDDLLYPDEFLSSIAVKIDKQREKKALRRRTRRRREADTFKKTGLRLAVEPLKAEGISDRKTIDYGTYLTKIRYRGVDGVPWAGGASKIAVICAEGQILGDNAKPSASTLRPKDLKSLVKQVMRDPEFDGVVIRINSPGGDARASDLMYREVLKMREAGLSVVASIGDVAASGGYYIAMGCEKIVADDLSITGSIGVVLAKLSFGKLLKKVGLNIERTSRGKYAELFSVERGFTEDEDAFWSRVAMECYTDFVSKAAKSRRMPVEDMNRRAQGRVWTGAQAKELGLVDEIGGLRKAIQVCQDMAEEKRIAREKLKDAIAEADEGGELLGEGGVGRILRFLRRKDATDDGQGEEEDDRRLGLFEGDVPVGPLGFPEEEYTELEAKIVAEARAEVAEKRQKDPDDVKVVSIEPRWIEKFRLLLSAFDKFDSPGFLPGAAGSSASSGGARSWLRRSRARAAAVRGVKDVSSAEGGLLKVLSDLTEQSFRPMAVLDDNIAQMMAVSGGVPREIRRLGVGPCLYAWLQQADALPASPVQLLGLLGAKQLLDKLDEDPMEADGEE